MFDRYSREITYLRISVTDKCNLRCVYCMPPEGVPLRTHAEMLSLEQMAGVARAAIGMGISKIRLTGGEPLVKRGIVDLVAMIAGVDGLETLAMTTNGILLAEKSAALRRAGLSSLNVSLDTLDPERYRAITRGGDLSAALAGIRAAADDGFPLKINMVVLQDTRQEEIERMREFAESRGAALQLIARFDLARQKTDGHGYDRPPSCARCNRIRLTADGMLKPCLHSDIEVRLDFLRLEDSLRAAIEAKPERGGACTGRAISQIGG